MTRNADISADLTQGLVRAWMGNGEGTTNGAGIDQSLNVSSQVDDGVGRYDYNITNAFAYAMDALGASGTCGQAARIFRIRNIGTTTTYLSTAQDTHANAAVDTSHSWSIVGELA